ncbi:hypothetical protein GCM10009030_34880 [Haloarcula pellucida]|uniref:Uncharacterized protein n=1 Tax=Haloarcula pellucida TaxID=1427151 RepID=A0A830GTK5_9EURY|nr:hypothetical protein GCM10009030_34880 [Halomicroarcula pellucida]
MSVFWTVTTAALRSYPSILIEAIPLVTNALAVKMTPASASSMSIFPNIVRVAASAAMPAALG